MPKSIKSTLECINQKMKLAEYWSRPSAYVQPKIIHYTEEDLTTDKYLESVGRMEMITGGRQIPNRKPKY
jgi:hypothetical protein